MQLGLRASWLVRLVANEQRTAQAQSTECTAQAHTVRSDWYAGCPWAGVCVNQSHQKPDRDKDLL